MTPRTKILGALAAALVALALYAGCSQPTAANDDPRLADAQRAIVEDGNFARAQQLAEAVLAEHANTGRAELLLGLAIHKQKLYSLAIPHFERALELAEDEAFERSESAHYYLGWAYYNTGEVAKSRSAMQTFLELNGEEGDAHFVLGLLAQDDGELDEAKREFELAADLLRRRFEATGRMERSLLPEIAKALVRLAEVHEQLDELLEARINLEAACYHVYPPDYPQQYTAWYRLYRVLEALGEDIPAKQALAKHERFKEIARSQGVEVEERP